MRVVVVAVIGNTPKSDKILGYKACYCSVSWLYGKSVGWDQWSVWDLHRSEVAFLYFAFTARGV